MVTPDIADAIGARAQGPWMQGYNNESLGRSLANDRLRDTIWIVENCEARANAARPD